MLVTLVFSNLSVERFEELLKSRPWKVEVSVDIDGDISMRMTFKVKQLLTDPSLLIGSKVGPTISA